MLIRRTKQAFTLAEVLLTLAIIGVVAALTIPAVITKVTNAQFVTGAKKAYNTLKSIEQKAAIDFGDRTLWDPSLSETEYFNKYYKPYLDVLKDCKDDGEEGCWGAQYRYLNGGQIDPSHNNLGYNIITSDGMSMKFDIYTRWNVTISVDVNGPKGPNVWGKDVYAFEHCFYIGMKPFGSHYVTADIEDKCYSGGSGDMCIVKVLSEGKINYSGGSSTDTGYGWPVPYL